MPQDDSLPRWQGKTDALLETVVKQVDTLFKAQDIEEKARHVEHEEIRKSIKDGDEALRKDVVDVATKLSNLTSKLAVIVAIFSFLGTVVTSLFVAAIIKIFVK